MPVPPDPSEHCWAVAFATALGVLAAPPGLLAVCVGAMITDVQDEPEGLGSGSIMLGSAVLTAIACMFTGFATLIYALCGARRLALSLAFVTLLAVLVESFWFWLM